MEPSTSRKRLKKNSERRDEIVEEIPVYVSSGVKENLCIFQYPTKPPGFIENEMYINSCRIKPESKEVKLEVALDTDSVHFDPHKADRFGRLVIDSKNEKPSYKPSYLDSLIYSGSKINIDTNKFVSCFYQDNEIHMCPLNSIIQMRPTVAHFDQEDKMRKAAEKAENEDENDEVKAVTVKFANAQDRSNRFKFLKKENDEPWVEAIWHTTDSIQAGLEKQRIFATDQDQCSMMPENEISYGKKMLPSDGGLQGVEALLPPRQYSKQRTKPLDLLDQMKIILKDSKILRFNEIFKWIIQINEENIDKDKVLRTLGQVGLLFHGNWIPKSEVLYPTGTVSSVNGVNADLMVRARDYVIFKLSRQEYLYRKQTMYTTQLPAEETLEILRSCAKLGRDKKWVPALPRDEDFEEQYRDLVERQDMYWSALEHFFQELENEKPFKRVRQRSQRSERSD